MTGAHLMTPVLPVPAATRRRWRGKAGDLFRQGANGSTTSATDQGPGQQRTARNGTNGDTTSGTDGTARQCPLLLIAKMITTTHSGTNGDGD